MSQNDKLLRQIGVPVLNTEERVALRRSWQRQTWDDLTLYLNSYGKYSMLRPTGFGKTYTCACACNIGAKLKNGTLLLNNGGTLENHKLATIYKKKVLFVYTSEILKQTFEEYISNGLILNGAQRVVFETYNSVAKNWNDKDYLLNELKIQEFGLIIFDEMQRMGAIETAKSLNVAMKLINKLGIYYIGATATPERATGYDVNGTYFKHVNEDGSSVYCWGDNIYTLSDAINTGLLIPPYYQFITDNEQNIKKYRGELRQTRQSMVQELKTMSADDSSKEVLLKDIRELERAVIKNSSKIVHDTMMKVYDCEEYASSSEVLEKAEFGSIETPEKLPKYMRFLVFTPSQAELKQNVKVTNDNGDIEILGNMVQTTYNDFDEAFGRYGYRVRTTIISSANSLEKNNVKLIDNYARAEFEHEKALATKSKAQLSSEDDIELGKAVVPQDKVIDLIFSINMLNVGYHVNNITGLIFKRWTGSNQIYFQQLGRCLSSVSDTIPVVFDYVNVVDSRGITAPLYTYDRELNKVTENADGTTNVEAKKGKQKQVRKLVNDIELDNSGYALPVSVTGKPINPNDINFLDGEHIIVDTEQASVDKLLSRCLVYTERTTSKKIFEEAYNEYRDSIVIENNTVVSDINYVYSLEDTLRKVILRRDAKAATSRSLSINFKSFIEYLKDNKKDLYVVYTIYREYIQSKCECTKFKSMTHEINTIIAATKRENNPNGATLKLLIKKEQLPEIKSNKVVLKSLKALGFNPKNDLVYYEN